LSGLPTKLKLTHPHTPPPFITSHDRAAARSEMVFADDPLYTYACEQVASGTPGKIEVGFLFQKLALPSFPRIE
jgi:hypothetical protein